VVESIFRLLGALPLPLMHAVGGALGVLVYLASPTYRRHLRDNVALAQPPAGLRLRLRVAREAGKTVFELPAVWARSPARAEALVREAVGWETVAAALADGHGALMVSPHIGCYEVFGAWFLPRVKATAMYRRNKYAALQRIIEAGRGRFGTIAPADMSGVRTVLGALKRREAVLVLPDQVPGRGEGMWLPFFGRPAYTMTLVGRLTATAGTRTFMLLGERLPWGRGFRLHFIEPEVPIEGSTEERALRINQNVERVIRRCPAQYLWGYNRYKQPGGAEPPPPYDTVQ
jgi:KDO2-lipid IV(A) lauroyltransferase